MTKRRSTKQKQRHHARAKKYSTFHNFYVNMEDNDRWKLSWHESNVYDLEEEERRRLEEERQHEEEENAWERRRRKEEEEIRLAEAYGTCTRCWRDCCSCPLQFNRYFSDDNWYEREHDSWESLRDKD